MDFEFKKNPKNYNMTDEYFVLMKLHKHWWMLHWLGVLDMHSSARYAHYITNM